MSINISEYTEDSFISRLLAKVPTGPGDGFAPGDDAAIIELAGARFLACADGVEEDVHFDLELSSAADAGWKALAVNLSDIAAMGGTPAAALVILGIPPGSGGLELAEDAYEGLGQCADRFKVVVAGGDVVGGPRLSLAVTVLGSITEGTPPLLRSGAHPGDLVCVTGCLGEAAMALELRLPAQAAHSWSGRLRRPVPRITAGKAIAAAGGTAAIDVSDGLLLDLSRLCSASGVGARIDPAQVPCASVDDWPSVEIPPDAEDRIKRAALGGGDDYELCFALPRRLHDRLNAMWPEDAPDFSVIGEVTDGRGISGPSGVMDPAGWDHVAAIGDERSMPDSQE